jgi:hypothetical protein
VSHSSIQLGAEFLQFDIQSLALCLLVLDQLPSDGDRTNENQLLPSAVFSSTSEDLVPIFAGAASR